MAKFLLDENLSPRISKYLEERHGLDVVPLRELGRTGIPDQNVADLAWRHGRVLITRDKDFSDPAYLRSTNSPGVLWAHPIVTLRTVEGYKQILDRFFTHEAGTFDVEASVIEITEQASRLLFRVA